MVFSRVYNFIRLFSLDIIAGALASLVYSSRVMGIDLPWSYYTVLALTVWLIYTADHLMDGAKTLGKSDSEARNFFYKYKIPIILVFLVILVFTFRLSMYRLDEKIIEFGMAPAVAVVIYLLLNRYYGSAPKWFFIKELWIALIYTLAIWGGPVIHAGDVVNPAQILLIASFFLVIFGNVLIYSIYEREIDIREDNNSLVRDFGIRVAVNTAVFSLSFSILSALSAFIFLHSELIFCMPILLIASSMLLIISFPGVFSERKLYGKIADLILLLFLLVLIG
jgi:4-hydroxybenzoate polyprenyltransferase